MATGQGDHLTSLERAVFDFLLDTMRPLNNYLEDLPKSVWHASAVGLFVLTAILVSFVPKRYIYAGAPDQSAWRDLRVWTAVALAPYALIYYFLQ